MPTGDYMPPHPEVHKGPCEASICDIQSCMRAHNFDEHECYPVISRYIECAQRYPEAYYVPEHDHLYTSSHPIH